MLRARIDQMLRSHGLLRVLRRSCEPDFAIRLAVIGHHSMKSNKGNVTSSVRFSHIEEIPRDLDSQARFDARGSRSLLSDHCLTHEICGIVQTLRLRARSVLRRV